MEFFKKQKDYSSKKQKTESLLKESSSRSQVINECTLRDLFGKCGDINFETVYFYNKRVLMIYCTGLVSTEMLYGMIPKRLEECCAKLEGEVEGDKIIKLLNLPSVSIVQNEEQAVSEIFSGKLFIDFGLPHAVVSIDISDRPQRSPEETKNEVTILGPRDNFID